MFGLGFGELLLIAVVVVLLFGSKKIPQLGQALGDTVKGFRKAFRDAGDEGQKPPTKSP